MNGKSKKNKIVFGIILSVVIIAAAIGGVWFVKKNAGKKIVATDNFTCKVPKKYKFIEEGPHGENYWLVDKDNYFTIYEHSSLNMSLESCCEYGKVLWTNEANIDEFNYEICENTKYKTAKVKYKYKSSSETVTAYQYWIHTTSYNLEISGFCTEDTCDENFKVIDDIFASVEFTGTEPQYESEYENDKYKVKVPEGFIVTANEKSIKLSRVENERYQAYATSVSVTWLSDKTYKEAAEKLAEENGTNYTEEENFLGKYTAYKVYEKQLPGNLLSFDSTHYYFQVGDKNYSVVFSFESGNTQTEKELMGYISDIEFK